VPELREFCPHCGSALRSRREPWPGAATAGRSEDELVRNRKRVLVIGAAILLTFGLVGKASWFGATINLGSGHRHKGPVSVQADQLFRAYRDNAHAADRRYGRREIVATGEFLRIAPDGSGDPDLRLKTSDPDAPLGIDLIRASQGQATELKPGQTVTVSCERVDRTGDERWLRNCAIQEVRGPGAAQSPPAAKPANG
jgi:hypothetical protein